MQIVDGHLRAEENPDTIFPVLVLDITAQEADKVLLTLDPLAALAESDAERITDLLRRVNIFDDDAVRELLKRTAGNRIWEIVHPHKLDEAEVSPELADQLQKKWGTKINQLWRAGRHRIICGDCTDETIVARLFDNPAPPLFRIIVTDPPYGVSYAAKNPTFLNALDPPETAFNGRLSTTRIRTGPHLYSRPRSASQPDTRRRAQVVMPPYPVGRCCPTSSTPSIDRGSASKACWYG